MMVATRKVTTHASHTVHDGRHKGSRAAVEQGTKQKISATERWVMISKNVYSRAQQRGFVGGDPFEDLSEAAREVDETYATDVRGLLALTDPVELVEQFRDLFAGYGLGKRSLDKLLEMNQDALEKLAASNRRLINGASDQVARRTTVLRDGVDEAMKTLHSLARTAAHPEEAVHLITQPTQAVKSVMSRLSTLANSAPELAEADAEEDAGPLPEFDIHSAVIKAYADMDPAELADAPVSALKGVSAASGDRLKAAFHINSIRELATSKMVERAEGVVAMADADAELDVRADGSAAGRNPMAEVADGPVDRFKGVSRKQAQVLQETFHIESVRDLAINRFFRVARAIVILADLEDV